MKIASIHSDDERLEIEALLNAAEEGAAWIGLDYDPVSGWFWMDGTPFDYDNWGDGMPKIPNPNSYCVAI